MKNVVFFVTVLALCNTVYGQKDQTTISDSGIVNIIRNADNVVERFPNGEIDWTNHYVTARGWTAMDTAKFQIPGQAELMARTGAITVAQRNLMEIIYGVRIVSETTVRDCVTEGDYIYKRLDAICIGAEMVGEPIVKGNIVEVTMRIPLYESVGTNQSVAEIMHGTARDFVAKRTIADPNNETNTNGRMQVNTKNMYNGDVNQLDNSKTPSLFPVVLDSSGNILVDYTQYFDPTKGNFPKYYNLAQNVADELNLTQAENVLDAVPVDGKIVVNPEEGSKFDKWLDAGMKVLKIGTFLMTFL